MCSTCPVSEAADEAHDRVAQHRPWQQPGLQQDLEAVADADDQPASGREVPDRLHHRGEAGDGPAAQVVAVGEPAGQDEAVVTGQVGVLVPDVPYRLLEHFFYNMKAVQLAVGTGKNHNPEIHFTSL
jgi:hypothetical protein